MGEKTVKKLYSSFQKFVRGEEGATMVEYGLMLALIAVVCLAAVTTVGTGAKTMFTSVSASL
jgi:pilus assembly protein Flp/PilA